MTRTVDQGGWLQLPEFAPIATCRDWTARIVADRKRWRVQAQAWLYGRAYYHDMECGDLHEYHRDAAAVNKLVAKLPAYVETMKRAGGHLAGPGGKTGLPLRARRERLGPYWVDSAFHINARLDAGPVHADYEGLAPYPAMMFDKSTRAFSAVLAVSAPEQGGGLVLWEKRHLADETPKLGEPVRLDYPQGMMTIIDSFLYHQIAATTVSRMSYRIAGVMHFLYHDKPSPHWEYWF